MTASALRSAFYSYIAQYPDSGLLDNERWPFNFGLMTSWYGSLNAVVEGWHDLGLANEHVDELLAGGNPALLNALRNATFHYQRDYLQDRIQKFVGTPGTAEWVIDLHESLGNAILLEMQLRNPN